MLLRSSPAVVWGSLPYTLMADKSHGITFNSLLLLSLTLSFTLSVPLPPFLRTLCHNTKVRM